MIGYVGGVGAASYDQPCGNLNGENVLQQPPGR